MTTTPSGIFRVIDASVKRALLVIVGLALMIGGFGFSAYLAETATRAHQSIPKFAYFAGFVGLFGALALPSLFDVVWPRAKQVFILVFPNGITLPWSGVDRRTPPTDPK